MMLGLAKQPAEGWPLEDVEAVLFQAVNLGKIMPFDKFQTGNIGADRADDLYKLFGL